MTAGVLFDCDGVLVDSEPIANRVLAEMITAAGYPITTEQSMRTFMGASRQTVMAEVERLLGGTVPAGFSTAYDDACRTAFEGGLRPVEGIAAALDAITAPTCVASSGSHRKMRLTLGLTGLLDRFEGRIFSATEVEHGKPAPDLFRHAAARMGFEPARSVVVEDTTRGVRAGVAAGMTVLAYADLTPAGELERAGGRPFTAMAELPELVAAALR